MTSACSLKESDDCPARVDISVPLNIRFGAIEARLQEMDELRRELAHTRESKASSVQAWVAIAMSVLALVIAIMERLAK